jgi:succinate dehydrogenase / fumarate reductase membrane anchor subunit
MRSEACATSFWTRVGRTTILGENIPRATIFGSSSLAVVGTAAFWRQRVTSVLGLLLAIGTILIILSIVGADHSTAVARLRHPAVATLFLLTILNFCVHMGIGMQVIIEDYVHKPAAKTLLLMANTGIVVTTGTALALVKIAVAG